MPNCGVVALEADADGWVARSWAGRPPGPTGKPALTLCRLRAWDPRARRRRAAKVAKLPKKKCCVSTKKCGRCPLRMLKEGTLPPGYTVKKRRLVKVEVVIGQASPASRARSARRQPDPARRQRCTSTSSGDQRHHRQCDPHPHGHALDPQRHQRHRAPVAVEGDDVDDRRAVDRPVDVGVGVVADRLHADLGGAQPRPGRRSAGRGARRRRGSSGRRPLPPGRAGRRG